MHGANSFLQKEATVFHRLMTQQVIGLRQIHAYFQDCLCGLCVAKQNADNVARNM